MTAGKGSTRRCRNQVSSPRLTPKQAAVKTMMPPHPAAPYTAARTSSPSHSPGIQEAPERLCEKGSAVGSAPWASIQRPAAMCR